MIPMTPQELIKTLVQAMGLMVDAKNKTLEINLKAYINDQNRKLESNLNAYIENKTNILKTEITHVREDINDFRRDVTGKINNHEDRITILEEVTTPLTSKH